MKKTSRILAALLLCCMIFGSGAQAFAAERAPLFQYGWEDWNLKAQTDANGVWQYDMTCPEDDPTMEALQNYTLDIMAYCKAAEPEATTVTIRFPFPSFGSAEMMGPVADAVGTKSGLRAVASPFLCLSSLRMKRGETSTEAILVLNVNNPYGASPYTKDIPFGDALDAARGIAADIAAKTSDPREQVELINRYLIDHTRYYYEYTGEQRQVHSIVGALLKGEAMCAGYTNAVSALCHLLDIPCYQIDDPINRHTWNVVKVDGKWLMLDTTFNDTGMGRTRFFLKARFGFEYHAYTEALLATLEGLAESLWQRSAAAEAAMQGAAIGLGPMAEDSHG